MSLLRLSIPARIAVGVVSSVAFASIGIEFAVRIEDSGAVAALWALARYFTYLTGAALAVALGTVALRGRWPGTTLPSAISVWIAVTGIVYHVLLAQNHSPEGMRALSNFGLHTLVPVGCIAVWIAYCPKHGMSYLDPLVWTVWPLVYCLYALLRGFVDGNFPYFFLDPSASGMPTVIAYIIALGLFFVLSGCFLVMLTRFPKYAVSNA